MCYDHTDDTTGWTRRQRETPAAPEAVVTPAVVPVTDEDTKGWGRSADEGTTGWGRSAPAEVTEGDKVTV